MSNERNVNGIQTSEISRNWSVAGTYADAPSLKKRDRSLEGLGFGKPLLFSPSVDLRGSITAELADHRPCDVCGLSLHKSARFCSSCGIPVNRDNSYENSW